MRALAALAIVVAGAVGGFAVYSFAWHEDSEPETTAGPRVYTLRDGDVAVRPEARTRCEASAEGGRPNLFCRPLTEGRQSVVFYEDWALGFGARGEPLVPNWSIRWNEAEPVKACGSISIRGRTVLVDIAEGDVLVSCATARAVMRRFIPQTTRPGSGDIRYRGRTYGCYKSRPDRVGWDFHCSWSTPSAMQYVDIGAGRRR
jgi:hypothetical protein